MSKYTHIAISKVGWFYFLENPYLPNNPTIEKEAKDKVIYCLVLGQFLEGGTIYLSELERYSSIYQLKKPIEYSRAYEILERCQNNQGITAPISYNPSLFWDNIKHKQDLYLLDYAFIRKSSKNKWCKRLARVYGTEKRGIKLDRGYLTADHPPIYTSSMRLRTMLWQILTTDKQLVKELAVKS